MTESRGGSGRGGRRHSLTEAPREHPPGGLAALVSKCLTKPPAGFLSPLLHRDSIPGLLQTDGSPPELQGCCARGRAERGWKKSAPNHVPLIQCQLYFDKHVTPLSGGQVSGDSFFPLLCLSLAPVSHRWHEQWSCQEEC